MKEPDIRRERGERLAQDLAFAGAVLVLAVALYAAWVSGRAEKQVRRFPLRTPSPLPTRVVTPNPWQASLRFYLLRASGEGLVLDPTRHTGDPTLLNALFLGLTSDRVPEGGVAPLLAEAWEVSEDGRVHTFRLRGDVFWVRCEPTTGEVQPVRLVTADDVAFAIERALEPETGAPDASLLYPIVGAEERHRGAAGPRLGIEVLDPFTVRFRLRAPIEDLPARLAAPVAWPVPREVVELQGSQWTEPGRLWVDGPYCLLARHPEGGLELVRNPFLPADWLAEGSREAPLPGAVPVWVIPAFERLNVLAPSGPVGVPLLDQVRFLGLWHPGPDGQPVPVLVESWERSEDGLQQTIRLREGIYWVRCDPDTLEVKRVRELEAGDVLAALILALRRGGAGALGRLLAPPAESIGSQGEPVWGLPGVEVKGRYTLVFTFREPVDNLDEILSLPLFWPVPQEELTSRGSPLDWSDGPYCGTSEPGRAALRVVSNPWIEQPQVLRALAEVWDAQLLPLPRDIPDRVTP
ncbi:MAG: ABC transporter substrate-binding protein [Chloroflexia bacterium]